MSTASSDRIIVIVSTTKFGFWSNDQGWVWDLESATRFTEDEIQQLNPPIQATHALDVTSCVNAGAELRWYEHELMPRVVLNDRAAVFAARERHQCDGEVEIDLPPDEIEPENPDPAHIPTPDKILTSRGDDAGCYVKAWVWVDFPEYEPPVYRKYGAGAGGASKKVLEQAEPIGRCHNCGWTGPESALDRSIEEVPSLFERVEPGEEMPLGECPKCGALCYIHQAAEQDTDDE